MRLKGWFVSRARLEASEYRSLTAQDQVRVLRAQVENLRAERDAALRDAADSRAMVADWLAEQMFGKRIYNSGAPSLPAQNPALDAVPSSSRISARQLVREAEARFFKDYETRQGQTSDDLMLSATS